MPNFSESEIEGWNQNRKLVLDRLDRVTRAVESLDAKVGSDLTEMKVELATMRTKVGLYAAVVGTVISILFSALISYLTRR